jgi:RNA polymerase sigma factor (sigma-70 family)
VCDTMVLLRVDQQDTPQENATGERGQHWHALLTNKEDVLRATRPRLIRLAQLRGVAPDAIEDVVQETLLEAWKHLDRLQSPDGFQFWINEICRNVCRRYARRRAGDLLRHIPLVDPQQADTGESGEDSGMSILDVADPHTLDLSEELSRQELNVLLDRALGKLPGNTRSAVELCYLAELPQSEAAARLGLTISALEARLHRARRQLRQILSGPLREDAEALGLSFGEELAQGWRESRIWCPVCGRRRLRGTFIPKPGGSVDLHMECPDCSRRLWGKIVSMGLVDLSGLRSFRPAWKRTQQGLADLLAPVVSQGRAPCPLCGAQASAEVLDTATDRQSIWDGKPFGCDTHEPYFRFWIRWHCPRCAARNDSGHPDEDTQSPMAFSADDQVYWSHPVTRQFILDHPHYISEPDVPAEYMGQPAIRFRMTDLAGAERMTILAHRYTLEVLAIFRD